MTSPKRKLSFISKTKLIVCLAVNNKGFSWRKWLNEKKSNVVVGWLITTKMCKEPEKIVGASDCGGFSCCRALTLGHTGLFASQHVGSSWVRDWTHVTCTGRHILYHWTTRKTLFCFVSFIFFFFAVVVIVVVVCGKVSGSRKPTETWIWVWCH